MAYNDSIAIRNVPPARSLVPISLHNVQIKQNPKNQPNRNRKRNKSGYNGGVIKNSQGDNQQPNAGNAQGGNQQPNAGNNQGGNQQPNAGNNNRGNLQQQQGNNQSGPQQPQQGINNTWGGQRFCFICASTDHILMQCPSLRLPGGRGNGSGGQNPSTPPNTFNAQPRKPLCWLCETEGTHNPWRCPTYATPAARRQRLENLNKCTSCARYKHEGVCSPKIPCSHHPNHKHVDWLCGGAQDPHPGAI